MSKKSRAKQEKHKEKTAGQNPGVDTFYWIVFVAFCALAFYPPYFRGMFFDKEFLPTHIYTGILFIAWTIYKYYIRRDARFFRSPQDYFVLGLAAAYALSFFWAASPRFALGEALKYINYFLVFYMAGDMARDKLTLKILMNVMLASAVGVALIGIGAAAGTVAYNGAVVAGRINSSLQYPNSLAAYLTAALAVSLTLQLSARLRWAKAVYGMTNFVLFFTFIFTYSRAAWLLFPVFFLIFVIGIPGKDRLPAVGHFMLTASVSALCVPGFAKAFAQGGGAGVWAWFLGGAAANFALCWLVSGIHARLQVNVKALAAVAVMLLVLAGAGAYVALSTEAPLELAHGPGEDQSYKGISREVPGIKPDTDYTLTAYIMTENPDDQKWAVNVRVNSYDEAGNATALLNVTGNATREFTKQEYGFTTRKDTKTIRVYFYNYYPGTRAVIKDVNLYETANPESLRHVVLKYKYIPEAIANRLASISLEERSAAGRLAFYKDALKMIKARPVAGFGGGGWKAAYFGYQSYEYYTTEVHSGFLQVWVETGTIGFLILLAIWAYLLYNSVKYRLSDAEAEDKLTVWGLTAGAAALGGHSMVDFNLSLGAISFYLWMLVGIAVLRAVTGAGKEADTPRKAYQPAGAAPVVAIAGAILFCMVSVSLNVGFASGQRGVDYVGKKDAAGAIAAFEKAAKFDPLTASFRADLSSLYEAVGKQTKSKEMLDKSLVQQEKAVELAPYDADMRTRLSSMYLERGMLDKGISELEKAAKLHPYKIDYYEYLAEVYRKAGVMYLTRGEKDTAAEYFGKSQGLLETIARLNETAPEKTKITNRLSTDTTMSRLLLENINDERYYKKIDELVYAANFTTDTDGDGWPDLWRPSNSKDGYLEAKFMTENGRSFVRLTNSGSGASYLLTTEDINLKPRTAYTVKLTARGTVKPQNLKLDVITRTGQTYQLQLKEILLQPGFGELAYTFVTTKDIEPGKQWLRFTFIGNDTGYADIGSVEIWEE